MTTLAKTKARGHRLVLYDIPWQTYVRFLHALEGRHLRITYDRGAFEIMTLSLRHEGYSSLFSLLITVLAMELNIPVRNAGSTTLKRRRLHRGLEPDKCFYIGNEPAIRGKTRLDLRVDPPPDLAIEIDVTPSSLNRVGIYAKLGVPEVWRFDGETLRAYVLDSTGHYQQTTQSLSFPKLPLDVLAGLVARTGQSDDASLVREFQAWVRAHLVGTIGS